MLDSGRGEGEPRFEDVAATLQLLGNEMAATRQLLEVGTTWLVVCDRSEAFLHDGACTLNIVLP